MSRFVGEVIPAEALGTVHLHPKTVDHPLFFIPPSKIVKGDIVSLIKPPHLEHHGLDLWPRQSVFG